MISIPLFNKDSTSSISTSGKWKLVFGNAASGMLNRPYAERKTISALGYGFTYWTESDAAANELDLYVSFDDSDATSALPTQQQAEIPIAVIYAALAIVGLIAGAVFLKRVEKVIDNPAVEIGLVVAALIALVVLYRYFRKQIG